MSQHAKYTKTQRDEVHNSLTKQFLQPIRNQAQHLAVAYIAPEGRSNEFLRPKVKEQIEEDSEYITAKAVDALVTNPTINDALQSGFVPPNTLRITGHWATSRQRADSGDTRTNRLCFDITNDADDTAVGRAMFGDTTLPQVVSQVRVKSESVRLFHDPEEPRYDSGTLVGSDDNRSLAAAMLNSLDTVLHRFQTTVDTDLEPTFRPMEKDDSQRLANTMRDVIAPDMVSQTGRVLKKLEERFDPQDYFDDQKPRTPSVRCEIEQVRETDYFLCTMTVGGRSKRSVPAETVKIIGTYLMGGDLSAGFTCTRVDLQS